MKINQPPPEKQECWCHEWTGTDPQAYHCSHCPMRGKKFVSPHQDEGMEWEKFDRLWNEDGRFYIAYGIDYRAVGHGGKSWKDQQEIMRKFIKHLLAKDRQQLRKAIEEKKLDSVDKFYGKGEIEHGFETAYNKALSDCLAILEEEGLPSK